jgi:hydroxymethylglutaryl-CoA lyase
VLERIRDCADEAGIGVVAYISMAFGNPYGDMWSEEKVAQAARAITGAGINSLSLADTIGAAEPDLIHRVLSAVLRDGREFEVGVHLHSIPAGARAKVLAAYDAGCRRFDSAIGGLGGCPLAQDKLVGNVPTEEVLRALRERGLTLPVDGRLSKVLALNGAISDEFSANETSSSQT